ncbi:MAG: adaptor protein MecA, partial [Firmicutes bacterium]|nr:adaptor protein MecA [Bacillota bacterium]
MRIEAITRRKVVVELSAEDMTTLDITYEALDYASVETRRVIWVILDRVRECTGCDIDPSGQLLIDAMPRPTGGCILFFTLRGGNPEPAAEPAAIP